MVSSTQGQPRVGGENLHAWKILRQGVEMNGPPVVETDAAAALGIRAEDGETDVEHDRLAARLQHFPDAVVFPVARIEALVRGMKLETHNFWVFDQLLGVVRDGCQILRHRYPGRRARRQKIWDSSTPGPSAWSLELRAPSRTVEGCQPINSAWTSCCR